MRTLYLDDKKVLRRFGKRPDLGRAIGGASPTKEVEVSSPRWVIKGVYDNRRKKASPGIYNGSRTHPSIIKGEWVNTTPVTVRCMVALRCVGKGKWQALCQEHHRQYVEWWLVEHCGSHGQKPDYDFRANIKR